MIRSSKHPTIRSFNYFLFFILFCSVLVSSCGTTNSSFGPCDDSTYKYLAARVQSQDSLSEAEWRSYESLKAACEAEPSWASKYIGPIVVAVLLVSALIYFGMQIPH
jgi:hypothetical protein